MSKELKKNLKFDALKTIIMTHQIKSLVNPNVLEMQAYKTARLAFEGGDDNLIMLDANENPKEMLYTMNRYPGPEVEDLITEEIAEFYSLKPSQIFLGNGSSELIDIFYKVFANTTTEVIMLQPSFDVYRMAAQLYNVPLVPHVLDENYSFKASEVLAKVNENTRGILICSPNNPTGNLLPKAEILEILNSFEGIVVLDEAYIDYCIDENFAPVLDQYPNLILLRTMSKAWGMAGARIGYAVANEFIIDQFNKVKFPYHISTLNLQLAYKAIQEQKHEVKDQIAHAIEERKRVENALEDLTVVERIFQSDANFILVKVADGDKLYTHLMKSGIVVRSFAKAQYLENTIRITIGTDSENEALISALKQF